MSKVDYLTEDTLQPAEQKFVCLSFLSDKENKTSLTGVKVRGVFATYEDACAHCKKLREVDPYFHVFVGEVGKWLPYDPNPDSESVKNSEYANEQLNSMMKGYLENQEKAKLFHEQRKTENVKKAVVDNLTTRKNNLKDLNKQLSKTKSEKEKHNIETNMKTLEDEIRKLEGKQTELNEQLNNLTNTLGSFESSKKMEPPKIIDV